jgi:hypothetical protein
MDVHVGGLGHSVGQEPHVRRLAAARLPHKFDHGLVLHLIDPLVHLCHGQLRTHVDGHLAEGIPAQVQVRKGQLQRILAHLFLSRSQPEVI